jgi:hypothetical protein
VTRYADITFRPIDEWPGEMTRSRRRAPFRTTWGTTIKLLERELGMLGARLVVFQIAVDERDLRIDGKPRAQARAAHPGVILAFESKWGPLKYAVDAFDRWEDNVRAIALAMEALRKVDRYGVTLPASTDPADAIVTREQAHDYLQQRWGGDVRKALMETHPDRGGDPDEFRRVVRAKELTA